MSNSVIFNQKDVAAMFGVKPRTIMDWRKKGKIGVAFFLNGRPRFTMEEIEKVVCENQDVDYTPMKFRQKQAPPQTT
jgi:predicted site-specific integrase-resolvase